MTSRSHAIKQRSADIRQVALRRHRGGEDARRVVQGISDGMDGLLRSVFAEDFANVGKNVTLVAVGGYGRRELCPFSDVDILFLCDELTASGPPLERLVRNLWDSGLQLGHSVRSPAECLDYMKEDDVTAATLLECRYLAGSEGLMRRFHEQAINRYKKLYSERFTSRKLETLRQSIEGEGRTIFVTEPHVKEGMCCMRDVQHILWIERLRRDVLDFEDIAHHGGFSYEEVRKIEDAYRFYLRVRCELHFLNGLRQDILERDSQVEVARQLGYEDDERRRGVEKLMSDYYRHAQDVLNFARFYLETKSRGVRFLSKLRHRIFASRINSSVSFLDGRLYLSEEPRESGEKRLELILRIFQMAQARNAELSQSLCEWIRRQLAEQPPDCLRTESAYRAFLATVAAANAGRTLTMMHETGVLGRLMPEFGKLTSLVNLDGHHQFTVDEHTLRALRELDRIENDPDYPEAEFRKVLSGIRDRLPLRLALLLHDIGKSTDVGAHDATGTEAAVVICQRLGLDEATTETIEFLIYRHLVMFRFSERVDFTDEAVIARFASLLGSVARLDMLYLLTFIDIHSVGPGTWTSWKGAQLSELYQRTRILMETGRTSLQSLEEMLGASGIDAGRRGALLEHCCLMENPSYPADNIPERMLSHLEMVDAYKRERAIQVSHEEMIGCHQVTFCAPDRPHLFADLAGLLLSEGFNILAARLYSRSDGIALDLFQVVIADKLKVDVPKRVDNLRRKLERIEKGTVKISELITDRWRRYRLNVGRRPIYPPRVEFHDELSRKCTVVEVDAGDRPGLLYDLATTIADLGLDLRTAKVSTMIDRARDVFHVVDRDGNKVVSTPRRQEIIEALSRAADWRDLSASEAEKPAASYPPSTVAAVAPSRAPRPIDSEDPPAEAGTR